MLSYVSGYLVKKIKNLDCNLCRQALLSENLEPQHLYTSFKENDNKKRLKYVTENLANYLAELQDAIYFFFKTAGESLRVLQKIKIALRERIQFLSWFPCKEHSNEVECKIFNVAVPLITRKFLTEKRKVLYKKKTKSI